MSVGGNWPCRPEGEERSGQRKLRRPREGVATVRNGRSSVGLGCKEEGVVSDVTGQKELEVRGWRKARWDGRGRSVRGLWSHEGEK